MTTNWNLDGIGASTAAAGLAASFCSVPMFIQQTKEIVGQLVATRRPNDRIILALRTDRCQATKLRGVVPKCTGVVIIRVLRIRPQANIAGRKPSETVKASTGLTALHLGAILKAMRHCMEWA